jgi:hypothetical protein
MEQDKEEGELAIAAEQQREKGQVAGNLLCKFEQILHDDPLMYVLFFYILLPRPLISPCFLVCFSQDSV